jgi:cytochrome c oxidase subunit 2
VRAERWRRFVRSVLRLTGFAGALLLASCDWLPAGATVQAQEMHQVWIVFLWASALVVALIWGLIAWCVVRWRETGRETSLPPQFKTNNPLEITWTVIPLIIVVGLFIYTYVAERHVEALATQPPLSVDVTGFRWSWRFRYPALHVDIVGTPGHPPQLVLPVGETVAFDVESTDVDHSFAVPAFLFKRDAIPGLANHFDWTPNRLGVFRGECGEFCGLNHALMTFTVAVVTVPRFRAWLAANRATAAAIRPENKPQ